MPQQLSPCVEINLMAAALYVGRKGSSFVRTFLPADSQPPQVLDCGIGKGGAAAVEIEVIHAQDKRAAGVACALKRGPKSARVPDMKIAGGRRREPAPVSRDRQLIGTGHAAFQFSQLRRSSTPVAVLGDYQREG